MAANLGKECGKRSVRVRKGKFFKPATNTYQRGGMCFLHSRGDDALPFKELLNSYILIRRREGKGREGGREGEKGRTRDKKSRGTINLKVRRPVSRRPSLPSPPLLSSTPPAGKRRRKEESSRSILHLGHLAPTFLYPGGYIRKTNFHFPLLPAVH